MADDLDEKNKQVKDNFMDEITKIVKKNVSENNDLTAVSYTHLTLPTKA